MIGKIFIAWVVRLLPSIDFITDIVFFYFAAKCKAGDAEGIGSTGLIILKVLQDFYDVVLFNMVK